MTSELENTCNANSLIKGYFDTSKGTDWKESVQSYGINLLRRVRESQNGLRNETYSFKPPCVFRLRERGHDRVIKSLHIDDRVVLNSFSNNSLLPVVKPKLIHNNGASIKGKGTEFARRHLSYDLNDYYRKFGTDGYIRFFDLSKFFDNIPHQQALEQYAPLLTGAENRLLDKVFRTFEVDVSYMSDEEYAHCMDDVFNSLEYFKIDKKLLTKQKFMRKSSGIGNQVSQVTGVFYPSGIDNLVKTVLGVKWYGRYMDDFYVIAHTVEELDTITIAIAAKCSELGLYLNYKKLRTSRLTEEFVFLKIIYIMRPNGKIIKRVCKSTFNRERRKLRRFKHLIEEGRMTSAQVEQCYSSWRGTYIKFDSRYEIIKMDRLYYSLFGGETKWTKGAKQSSRKSVILNAS
ncbi:MAG: Reverse transcriptase (RNA-dependent DNA polymerase) [Ruminococcus sp.]|nr:Reverse transcriptase (RNA-dependent DNA polymerase) [Ruminococcus sp.]MBR6103297.1 Reverse transcriptase (RNA-dependent DNA polymerase) [Ruminococcus sp.]